MSLQMSRSCSVMDQSLSQSLELLCGQGLGQLLGIWLLETLQIHLSSSVVPEFWSGLKQPENELEERGRAWVLLTTFRTLLDRLEPFLSKLTPNPKISLLQFLMQTCVNWFKNSNNAEPLVPRWFGEAW